MNGEREDGGIEGSAIGIIVSEVALALSEQVEVHIELARAELARDALALGRDLAPHVFGGALLGGAFLLGCTAGALALAAWLGLAGGFAAMSALNLLVGWATILWNRRRLRRRPRLTAAKELPHVR